MDSHWFLLLLLLLSRDRAFNLPGSVLVWVVASDPTSTKVSSTLDENLSCPSTSSVVPHQTNGHTSTEELNSSSNLPTSPQSSIKTGPTEQTGSTVHTDVKLVTNMPLLDPKVTSTAKEPVGSSKATILFSLSTSAETPPPNQTPPSSTTDKLIDTNNPLPTTTVATLDTSSSTATVLRTTVLGTATSETEEGDPMAVPSAPATSPTTSESPDTHPSTVTQTPSQPAQTGSDVSVTELTTLSPPRSVTTGMRSSVSPSPGKEDMTMTTPSTASSTPEDANLSSGTRTPRVPKKLTLTTLLSTPDKVIDKNNPLPTTTVATLDTSSSTATVLRTTVLGTATSETEEGDTMAVPSAPATVTQTPSQAAQTGSSVGLGTPQSSDHSTTLDPSSSETSESSTVIGTSKAPPSSSQGSGPGGGTCALDERPARTGGCVCNDSYYSHLELSREMATLRCRPQDIEVSLRSCFLKTQHWVLKQDTFKKCFSNNATEEGYRVQVFQLEKKEGTCGLSISTNSSHVLHSLDVHLEQALPGSKNTGFRVFHFSCAYPLAVNISKPVAYQEVSVPSIHVPNTGETVVTLGIFTDSDLTVPLKNSTAPVGMPLYVVLKSSNSDPDWFALVANEIFASSSLSNTEAKATYHFVKESCPIQGRILQDLSNGASLYVTLAFTLSRFLNSDMLYLHAQVTLCNKRVGHPCQPWKESSAEKFTLGRSSWDPDRAWWRQVDRVWTSPNKWILTLTGKSQIFSKPIQKNLLTLLSPSCRPDGMVESRASSSRSSAGAWISIFLLIVIGWMLE